MGRVDVVLNGLDNKKLDANSSGLSHGRDARTINGTAQSEIILSGHLDYKQARLLDSIRTRAILSSNSASRMPTTKQRDSRAGLDISGKLYRLS